MSQVDLTSAPVAAATPQIAADKAEALDPRKNFNYPLIHVSLYLDKVLKSLLVSELDIIYINPFV